MKSEYISEVGFLYNTQANPEKTTINYIFKEQNPIKEKSFRPRKREGAQTIMNGWVRYPHVNIRLTRFYI